MTYILLKNPETLNNTVLPLYKAWGEFTTSPLNLTESLQETGSTIDAQIDGPWSDPHPIDGVSLVAYAIPQPERQVDPSTRPIDWPSFGSVNCHCLAVLSSKSGSSFETPCGSYLESYPNVSNPNMYSY